ncbi:MAG: type I DNA topoisomerase [Patescibacteria group bacterium]
MKLVIVESPTKARTISQFLSKDYQVEASFGHVRDLPKSKIGIDVENNFKPDYAVYPKAKLLIKELKALSEKADEIILASDEDREGEAISWHLVQALGLGDEDSIAKGKLDSRVKRIVFHEITPSAVKEALKNPRSLELNLINSQQARRIIDRLVGYELSPFLWRKIRYGLSAGRVQSVTVRLIVEREREIEKFIKEEYWSIEGKFNKENEGQYFPAKLQKINDKTLGKLEIKNGDQAQKLISILEKADYRINNIEKREIKKNPSPPFTTSTLQQEASRKFGFSAKQTMMIAQQLYEGINLGSSGTQGLITYMRTDSLNLAQSALTQIRDLIKNSFGNEYALVAHRYFSNKSKGAQEAHEAIRPSDVAKRPSDVSSYLSREQEKIYDLIWKRAVACQMTQAIFSQTSVDIKTVELKDEYVFRATGQIVKFDGFIKVYTEGLDEKTEDESQLSLPELENNEILELKEITPFQHFTEPPARYTDATLIKALESNGVGRPSTYTPTLTTIQERGYAEKIEKKYHPTETGYLTNDMLVENFPEIIDINFTSHIEEEFDQIADGKTDWVKVCREFYEPFKKHLIEKEETVKKYAEISDTLCPHCGKPMIIKFGRMGKFLACPDPENKFTMPMPEEAAKIKELQEKTRGEKCPLCGGEMKIKRGRFGFFLGCNKYPECKGISKIWNKIGFKCPHCKVGDIVERKSRGRGKLFYSCNRYPACAFITNKKPENQKELEDLYLVWKNKPKTEDKKKSKIKGINPVLSAPPAGGSEMNPPAGGSLTRLIIKKIDKKKKS